MRDRILTLLAERDIPYRHVVHEATLTSLDSAQARGTAMEDGVKSIIVRGKRSGKNYQFNLPSHRKLDMKAVASLVGERCEFEDEGVIRERYGLLPGAVPPFGDVLGIWSYVDEAVLARTVSAFNCGLRTESVVMERQALLSVIEVKIARFAVETGGNPPTTDTGC